MRREPGAAAWIEQVVLHSPDPGVSEAFVAATMPTVASHVRFEPAAEGPGSGGEQQSDRLDPFWKLSVFTDDVDRHRAIRSGPDRHRL